MLQRLHSNDCIQALKITSELFETMSLMSEEYDLEYAKMGERLGHSRVETTHSNEEMQKNTANRFDEKFG